MAYTITLVGCKGDEIELIAMVMELCGLGMNEASNVVDHMPNILFENINEESANKYKKLLEGAGAILKIDEAAAPSSPDPFAFPEPDFGKMMAGNSAPVATPAPTPVAEPTPAPAPVVAPEPVVEPEPEPVVEPEPESEPARQSVVEITPRATESVQQVEKPVSEAAAPVQTEESASEDTSEEPKYEYSGYCPKCGSAFVTVKKVGGLFGSNKVKCVCEACKHKF